MQKSLTHIEHVWAIVNSIGDAVVAIDLSGKMSFYNPAAQELLGVEGSKEMADKWVKQFGVYKADKITLFPTEELPLVLALKGQETDGVIQFIRNEKRPEGVFISVTGRPMRDAHSTITGGVVVIRDISRQMEAEEETKLTNIELVAVNKELEAFSYSVSHDLRAPLRSISGFSDILINKHSAGLSAEGLDYLKRVKDSGDKLGQLIDGLLDLSRLTRGDIKRENINLSEIVKSVIADLKVANPERKINVEVTDGIIANADQRLLRSVLINLIGNAWKFTGKKPDAQIKFGMVTAKTDKPTYYVKDNGAGFNEEYSNKLFNIFQRLHSVKEFEGHGIGLATVQRVIHRHGGTVWAEGKLNEGATFYFTL